MARRRRHDSEGNGSEGGNGLGAVAARAAGGAGAGAAGGYAASIAIPAPTTRGLFIGEPDFWRLWLVGLVVFGVRWLEMMAVGDRRLSAHRVAVSWRW